ncbi:bifunctional riboflavin kinase/FAD synthetase [Anaerovorax odorimutans]|uniref:bifunctional riboflavin kinase/FAD synthetase n=1 Tax=Anaerovorax odorimutans TaxID=109327 RepID=UPI0004122A59|nr:bifunctional riboflavin kinase/FAD synthetase [Anaerovorax odorimutans]
MKIFNSVEEIKDIEETVVALGNFDGVHKGHQELIRRTVKSAKMAGLKSAVFTFTNHPKNVLAGKPVIKNILYPQDKADIIASLHVDYLFSLEFNEYIQHLSAKDFIQKLLIDVFKMRQAYCGFNYNFGYKAKGNPQLLIKTGIKEGFGIHVLEPFKIDDNLVSSTFIRKLIAEGKVDQCERYMGRNYTVGGEVVVGNRIGRTIGFPTSNILIDDSMVTPSHGVYITYCNYNGVRHPSVTNVGIKPTIGDNKKTIETHIFDFNKELYGKKIRVEFLEKIRNEIKFENVDQLSDQIKNDCLTAKKYHDI